MVPSGGGCGSAALTSPGRARSRNYERDSPLPGRLPPLQLPPVAQQVDDGVLQDHLRIVDRPPANLELQGRDLRFGRLVKPLEGLFRVSQALGQLYPDVRGGAELRFRERKGFG